MEQGARSREQGERREKRGERKARAGSHPLCGHRFFPLRHVHGLDEAIRLFTGPCLGPATQRNTGRTRERPPRRRGPFRAHARKGASEAQPAWATCNHRGSCSGCSQLDPSGPCAYRRPADDHMKAWADTAANGIPIAYDSTGAIGALEALPWWQAPRQHLLSYVDSPSRRVLGGWCPPRSSKPSSRHHWREECSIRSLSATPDRPTKGGETRVA